MIGRSALVLLLSSVVVPASTGLATEVRYREENGNTYRETVETVRYTVPETTYQQSQRTVLRSNWKTEHRPVVRTYQVPITEYRWEAQWRGRFNPFSQPYLTYQYVPRTRWEVRTETIHEPTTVQVWEPETTTVNIPVTSWKTVEEPRVVSRVIIPGGQTPGGNRLGAAPTTAPTSSSVVTTSGTAVVSPPVVYGGIARLDRDPPRVGSTVSIATAGGPIRR